MRLRAKPAPCTRKVSLRKSSAMRWRPTAWRFRTTRRCCLHFAPSWAESCRRSRQPGANRRVDTPLCPGRNAGRPARTQRWRSLNCRRPTPRLARQQLPRGCRRGRPRPGRSSRSDCGPWPVSLGPSPHYSLLNQHVKGMRTCIAIDRIVASRPRSISASVPPKIESRTGLGHPPRRQLIHAASG